LSLSSKKYGFEIRDLRSGKKPIPDPRSGSWDQKGTGSRIRNTDPHISKIKSKLIFMEKRIEFRSAELDPYQTVPDPEHCHIHIRIPYGLSQKLDSFYAESTKNEISLVLSQQVFPL
jgi:hypothetical protein